MESAQGMSTREVLACDESFFTALLAADLELLGTILADDFLIIDVLSGQVAHREELLDAISSGQLRFAEVTRHAGERSVRRRDSAAVVAGWTRMVVRYRGDEVTVQSRYTHVYTRENGRWRLMSAQGTPTRPPRMNAGREPLFCDTALAGRIERVTGPPPARPGGPCAGHTRAATWQPTLVNATRIPNPATETPSPQPDLRAAARTAVTLPGRSESIRSRTSWKIGNASQRSAARDRCAYPPICAPSEA